MTGQGDAEGKAVLGQSLDVAVDRQDHVVAGDGILDAEVVVQDLALGVDLDLPASGDPVQDLFVRRLDARVADELARVIAGERLLLELRSRDGQHIPEQVRGERPVRIAPDGIDLITHPRK